MPKYKKKITRLMLLIWEITIGRLVLDLPKDDLVKINEMIKRNLESK